MDKRNSIKLLYILGILVTAACLCTNVTGGVLPKPEVTNTPTFTSQFPPDITTETVESPVETAPPTIPPPVDTSPDRCIYFDGLDIKFTFHTIVEGDETMTLYLNIPGGVPGLEKEMPGDSGPFNYSATIGRLESTKCNFREYANRLYCTFPLSKLYYNTAQQFDLFLEGCDTAVFSHGYLTIPVETLPPP